MRGGEQGLGDAGERGAPLMAQRGDGRQMRATKGLPRAVQVPKLPLRGTNRNALDVQRPRPARVTWRLSAIRCDTMWFRGQRCLGRAKWGTGGVSWLLQRIRCL